MFRHPARLGVESAWWGHVPFAQWLIPASKPQLLVELGTHSGVSYSAFCESVFREHLETRCFAVDTWRGDEHAGFYGEDVYRDLRTFHDDRYGEFSTLLRTSFDQALDSFSDSSIDLLHIDGFHTYEAVKHDFEAWRTKLSDRSVLLLHDTAERQGGFGVWRLWEELARLYPHFEFYHSWGLGVIAIGQNAPETILELCSLREPASISKVRERFACLGERWETDMQGHLLRARIQVFESRQESEELIRAETRRALDLARSEAAKLRKEHSAAQRKAELETALREELQAQRCLELESRVQMEARYALERNEAAFRAAEAEERADKEAQLRHKLEVDHGRAARELEEMRREYDRVSVRYESVLGSASWHATQPARAISKSLPNPVKRLVLKALKLLWWIVTFSLGGKLRERRERRRQMAIIRQSSLFDPGWYVKTYPDVRAAGTDPVWHYCTFGAAEGRNPGPNFDGGWYLGTYPDVAQARVNPLLHYLEHGAPEGRLIRRVISD